MPATLMSATLMSTAVSSTVATEIIPTSRRIALGVEYLGSAYCGWQRQKDCLGVQVHLERALEKIACTPIEVFCAGRTDKGVHAMAQVVHFDSPVLRPDSAWVHGVNSHLPPDIRVLWQKNVSDDFHARFSAVARRYRYVLVNQRVRSAVFHQHQAWSSYPLDVSAMHTAMQVLVGEHDFSSFRAAECQAKHPRRCMLAVSCQRQGDLVLFDLEANAFLHHMVRNIVGSLLWIGRGEKPIDWLGDLLAAKDRKLAAPTAEPQGLYLTAVRYPEPWSDFPTVELSGLWQC